jgi:glycerol uptake facilitator protein
MGTLVLVLLGCGTNAGVTLRKSFAADSGWIVVATGWALAVLCGVLVAQAFGSPGANLNPAITLSNAIVSGDYSQVLWIWLAQLLGAIAGASLMALHYGPHWKLTPGPVDKLGVFATNAAVRNPAFNLLSEIIGTAVLIVVAAAIGSKGVSASGLAAGVGPLLISCLVWGIGFSLGGTTGYAWGRASPTLCCPSPAKADLTGDMLPLPSSALCWALCWRGCCCALRTCRQNGWQNQSQAQGLFTALTVYEPAGIARRFPASPTPIGRAWRRLWLNHACQPWKVR